MKIKKKLFFTIWVTSLYSVILLLQTVPMTLAYIYYGPYTEEVTIYLVDDYYDEDMATVTMYVERYVNVYYCHAKVTKVGVTIDYVWQRWDGYIELDTVAVETGEEPWNTWSCLETHWIDDQIACGYYMVNYNWEAPETYEAYPNVIFDWHYGQKGKCGIIETHPDWPIVWRLVADGDYLYVDTILYTNWIFRLQFAYQYYKGAVIIYRNGWSPVSFSGPWTYFI